MYSYGDLSSSQMGQLFGFLAGYAVFFIALAVFGIVCTWKIFEKAGEPGWKSLIPIYNVYIWFKVAWEGKWFFIPLLGMLLAVVISSIGMGSNSAALAGIGSFLMILVYLGLFVIAIIANIKLAKRFGKSAGFAVGLILLSIIFSAILAFDSSDYDRSRA